MSDLITETPTTTGLQALFKLKGSRISVSVLELYDYDYERFNQDLEQAVSSAPQLFQQMPVVISLEHMTHTSFIDFIEMCQLLNEFGLSPVAVSGGSEEQQLGASVAGLAKIERSGSKSNSSEPVEQKAAPASTSTVNLTPTLVTDIESDTTPPSFTPAKIIRQPVRSGQQIYAKDSDLIVLAPISQGAEILADGNIHVYAPLPGTKGPPQDGTKGDQT